LEILDLLEKEGVRLVPASKHHARMMNELMGQKGREEIKASGGFVNPEPAVRMSINHSEESWAAFTDTNSLLAIFGVQLLGPRGELQVPWALTTVNVEKHAMTCWRASKIIVSYLRGKYPYMTNMVHGQYREALSWVKHLGFEIGPLEPYGPAGAGFCRATLVTQKVVL
jgi:hypothetical protein